MRRILLAFIATAIVVAVSYISQPATTSAAPEPRHAAPSLSTQQAGVALNATATVPPELDRLIAVFERRTADSVDALDFRTLGGHYSARATVTGDIADRQRATDAYRAAYELAPSDRDGRIGYATAAASVHQFETALSVAESRLSEQPDDVDALALAGDAAAELGNLELAGQYYDRLDLLAPDHPAVLARLAGFAHLRGHQDDAISLARLAYEEAFALGETSGGLAFYPLVLSDLLLDAGRYDEAIDSALEAVALDTEAGLAQASLGRALSHAGQFADAIVAYETALATQQDAGWRVALADLLIAEGEPSAAAAHYEQAVAELAAADETIFGQSLATLYADLNVEVEAALALAEQDFASRQSIDAYDTLAWALYRNGRFDEARSAIDEARSTGAQDATLIYHSAVIAEAQGDQLHAIAELTELLGRNPGFHPLLSRHAVELLTSLAG